MIVHLDTKLWLPPVQYAKKMKVTRQAVNNWIARGQIETVFIKEWNMRFIRVTEVPDTRNR